MRFDRSVSSVVSTAKILWVIPQANRPKTTTYGHKLHPQEHLEPNYVYSKRQPPQQHQ